MGIAFGGIAREPHQLEQFGDPPADGLALAQAVKGDGLAQGLPHGQARVERAVGILEHHLDPPVIGAAFRALEVQHVEPGIVDAAGIGLVQAHQAAGQGRFPAARFADDAQGLAALHPKADAVERAHDSGRLARQAIDDGARPREGHGEIVDSDERAGGQIHHARSRPTAR